MKSADIFTKHLLSKDKVQQLVRLSGCECRAGCLTAAPLLRPKDSGGGQSGPPSAGCLLIFAAESEMRDPFAGIEAHGLELLPHFHSDHDTEYVETFPDP